MFLFAMNIVAAAIAVQLVANVRESRCNLFASFAVFLLVAILPFVSGATVLHSWDFRGGNGTTITDSVGGIVATLSAHNGGALPTRTATGVVMVGTRQASSSSNAGGYIDVNAVTLGGAMTVIGDPADPPVRLAGSQADVATATCAAASSLIALRHRERTGHGQVIDIASTEVVAAVTHVTGVGKWLDDGVIPVRNGTGLTAAAPSGAYPCIDGIVYLMINRAAHWKALALWIHEVTGNEEVLSPMFDGPSSARLPYRELLDLFISELTATLRVEEAYHEGQRRHIAFTPAHTAADVVANEQLTARNFFVQMPLADGRALTAPGAPYQHATTPWQMRAPAPALGEHNHIGFSKPRARTEARELTSSTLPLAGLRLVEFGAGMAGPWIGRFMAWCGADVIRIESAVHPDVTRTFVSPREPELGTQPQASPWLTDWNAGKRFVSLDLKNPDGAELCRRLIDKSDVLVSNFSAGVV